MWIFPNVLILLAFACWQNRMGNDLASYMRFGRIKTCAWCCHLGQTHNHHAGFVICIGCGASYKCLCEVHPHSFHGECLELPLGGKFMKEWLGWWDALTLRNFSWGLKSFVSERTQNFLSTLTHMQESPCTFTCNRYFSRSHASTAQAPDGLTSKQGFWIGGI